jgi:hypothetical protein
LQASRLRGNINFLALLVAVSFLILALGLSFLSSRFLLFGFLGRFSGFFNNVFTVGGSFLLDCIRGHFTVPAAIASIPSAAVSWCGLVASW